MNNEIALQEFRKLHDEIVAACDPTKYPEDSMTNSLFGKAKMLIKKFYQNVKVNRINFENELSLVKRRTKGFNNYQKLYSLEKFIANVILEDIRIGEKFTTSVKTESPAKSTKVVGNPIALHSWFDRLTFKAKNHKVLAVLFFVIVALIWLADTTDALVKLGFVKDDMTELQRQEFFTNNPPQFELWYSAFYPDNRDPLLKETLLDDTIGITGSYRLINKGRAIITLEKINLPDVLSIRGYFTDRIVELPYPLSPGDTIVISCKLPGKELPIIETENALKKDVSLACSYPVADIRFTYKFQWRGGLFRKARVVIE